ncbi:Glutamyl-tRNA amidotransferase B subunit [Schizopora paradoxa]|uniref:Glutamyl-tRNA(Gln) amidotransferase subunit B, mitochondrial n=1 Tax=Schizopora paradoxa TaxID=27342 RepID=A0A0H2RG68_9AGAM|nr:Glutamyl-tRNA amidotransferase B subunit [Schizopora paradoxa]
MFRRCVGFRREIKRVIQLRTLSSDVSYDKRWPGWQVVVGLEVHAQLKSRAKLFSNSWTSTYDEVPNSHVAPFDAAFPGTLPKLNANCVDLALRAAFALDSNPQRRSSFDRKHYFYSDLPSGYQITQYYAPISKGGSIYLPKSQRTVRINQIQLEQDTAKTTFIPRAQSSTVDLNRAGSALIEIVSEPDMRSPEEAGEYIRALQLLLRSVAASDCNMEEGSFRCDANVSVCPKEAGDDVSNFGTRCEIKNLNSVKFMMIAITAEVMRHINIISNGGKVSQETRGFDEHTADTYLLRSKEDAPDYRYMPDPNLPPLILHDSYIMSVREGMPELPDATRSRLLSRGLSERDVEFLISVDGGREVGFDGKLGRGGAIAFFDLVSEGRDAKSAFNWITHDLYGLLVVRSMTFKENPISVNQMRDLLDLLERDQVTAPSAKILLKHIVDSRSLEKPKVLAQKLGLMALKENAGQLEEMCRAAIDALPEEAAVVRAGNERVLNKLVGHVMRSSRGRANATAVHKKLREMLQQ